MEQNSVAIMKAVLTVKKKEYLTPHYIRIILEGEHIDIFKNANEGDNNKLLIPKNKSLAIELPNGPVKGKGNDALAVRTYTLRSLDLEKKEMVIDFVMHGDHGEASKWAISATKGDELGVLMKEKRKPLVQPANWYFLVGDHTALPVISVILEQLPDDVQGTVLLEVFSKEDVLDLKKPEGVTIDWIFNEHPGKKFPLLKAFQKIELPTKEKKFVYVAAEYHTIHEIQQALRADERLDRKDWYAFSYWKYGIAEDASAEERRQLQK